MCSNSFVVDKIMVFEKPSVLLKKSQEHPLESDLGQATMVRHKGKPLGIPDVDIMLSRLIKW
jgi:hypothetical protein